MSLLSFRLACLHILRILSVVALWSLATSSNLTIRKSSVIPNTFAVPITAHLSLLEIHDIDKGIDSNIRLEKQVINPVTTSEVKGISQIKPRIGQGRAGIKQKAFQLPVPPPLDMPEQPQLLPDRRPIIQIAERQFYSSLKMLYSIKHIQNFSSRKFTSS